MHDLLSFMPRPRMKHTPDSSLRRTVSNLIDDIQVLAAADESIVLNVLGQYAHEERLNLRHERHSDTSSRQGRRGDL